MLLGISPLGQNLLQFSWDGPCRTQGEITTMLQGHRVLPWPSELPVPPCPSRAVSLPSGSHAPQAVAPWGRYARGSFCMWGETGQQKNEFAFLNGTQCGNQSRGGFRCHSAPQRGCVKRQHPVCWQRARPVSPGCPCVPGNCCCRAAPGPARPGGAAPAAPCAAGMSKGQ